MLLCRSVKLTLPRIRLPYLPSPFQYPHSPLVWFSHPPIVPVPQPLHPSSHHSHCSVFIPELALSRAGFVACSQGLGRSAQVPNPCVTPCTPSQEASPTGSTKSRSDIAHSSFISRIQPAALILLRGEKSEGSSHTAVHSSAEALINSPLRQIIY